MTSDELLEGTDHLYRSSVIIGGGVIGVEFATFYSDLGCSVTLLEGMDRLLPNMDRELGQNLALILKKQGVQVCTRSMVDRLEQTPEGIAVHYTAKETPGCACLLYTSVDDAYLYRFEEERLLLVVNAANTEKDLMHLRSVVKDYDLSLIHIFLVAHFDHHIGILGIALHMQCQRAGTVQAARFSDLQLTQSRIVQRRRHRGSGGLNGLHAAVLGGREPRPCQAAQADQTNRHPQQGGHQPVSYTHLDVYKRQVRSVSPVPAG